MAVPTAVLAKKDTLVTSYTKGTFATDAKALSGRSPAGALPCALRDYIVSMRHF